MLRVQVQDVTNVDLQQVNLGAASAGSMLAIIWGLYPMQILAFTLENGRLQVPPSPCRTAHRAARLPELMAASTEAATVHLGSH